VAPPVPVVLLVSEEQPTASIAAKKAPMASPRRPFVKN